MSGLSEKDIIIANRIACRIKKLRLQDTGHKQADFVEKYNIDKQDISRWEGMVSIDKKTGKIKGRGVTVYTIQKFCDLIGISLKDFFDDELFK